MDIKLATEIWQFSCMFIGFIFSIKIFLNKELNRKIHFFAYYSPIAFISLTISTYLLHFEKEYDYIILYILNNSIVFHHLLITYLISKTIITKNFKLIYISITTPQLFFIIYLLNNAHASKNIVLIQSLVNFVSVLYSFAYLLNIFLKNNIQSEFTRDPIFWIISGIFLCLCLLIPSMAFSFLFKLSLSKTNFNLIYSLSYVLFGIMHLFFTKAYICLIKQSKI
jgi:hypothetical protein